MEIGHFYYIDDQYFKDFPDSYLMQNKEKVNGQLHDRPCFYAFQDSNTQLFWMIPFSSQTSKFKGIYNKKMQKYHRCDTIVFGEVLGHEKAFLIQNMCPITEKYMKNEYLVALTPTRSLCRKPPRHRRRKNPPPAAWSRRAYLSPRRATQHWWMISTEISSLSPLPPRRAITFIF